MAEDFIGFKGIAFDDRFKFPGQSSVGNVLRQTQLQDAAQIQRDLAVNRFANQQRAEIFDLPALFFSQVLEHRAS